ncbi:MAG: pyruvate dehydrogenase complex dihydrolipoamide acetyltransferase [Bacteroidia bacterium]|nr:pyruvate dehydrogenase complex dihydrolipoamide acetyltransferase [Bacteroidia bacterium]
MAEIVRMPKLSDTMTEGVVAKWHKKVGDKVKAGDLLADIETDKATMEFESFQDGVLLHQGVNEGATAPVDSILAILGKEGEDISALLKEGGAPAKETRKEEPADKKEETKGEEAPAKTESAPAAEQQETASDSRVKASPLAKSIAKDKGIDLSKVSGSGDGGRIVKKDVENYKPAAGRAASSSAPAVVGQESYEEVPLSQMRKTIARRLSESKFSAPHFYLTMEIDMDNAIAARKAINENSEVRISFNDLVIKAVAMALRKHPKVNASWLGDKIRYNHHIHIGVAVAIEEGLVVPVLKFADARNLSQINEEVKVFAGKARDKKLQPAEMEGNTFTISNLGMYGIEDFTAIINPPDSCIMAVGGIKQTPVVKNGQVVPGNVMKITLSCDHRSVDGATGSEFLQTFKRYMENPILMLS